MLSQRKSPPCIFSPTRKLARKRRAAVLADRGEPAWFLIEAMADDLFDRLGFLRLQPARILAEGFGASVFCESPWEHDACFDGGWQHDFDDPLPYTSATYDLAASVNSLGTVNDLVGALIQMRELLVPGGLAMASFVGGQSLGKLRRAMFEAEPDRAAPRMHPMIDPRSCPELLGRAGWADPVVDSYTLTARYSSLDRLVQDLREQALGNVLATAAPPLGRSGLERARAAFLAQADADGKVSETFEIITLTGRRSTISL
ncbi:methyltransferase [Erythrobacter sp. EC-HK427]|uniref:methyltransferase n=1 Tax=Erythrobacter sp. EC-HK427 TaxID=2038396 RepID=UPI001252B6B4|nr:methyltransferase [Erythrobacter sp. EC-HK427]VVT15959.1 conserved hypothetical protein [Erythrobacter sp. EC-HK427]